MKIDQRNNARLMADEIFENGSSAADIRTALSQLGDDKQEFLDRLAVRALLRASADGADPGAPPASSLDTLMASYEAQHPSVGQVDVAVPATWIAAKARFGNDMQFIMKLVGRQVSAPSHRFLRDAADALGVGLERLKEHFALTGNPTLAGVERKASGRQTGPQVESFKAAVDASNLPDDLKKRWLAE